MKKVVACDHCGKGMFVSPKFHRNGGIEYLYLRCPACKTVYPISATDEALRNDISRYQRMVDVPHDRHLTQEQYDEAVKLHAASVQRSRELLEQYPLRFGGAV